MRPTSASNVIAHPGQALILTNTVVDSFTGNSRNKIECQCLPLLSAAHVRKNDAERLGAQRDMRTLNQSRMSRARQLPRWALAPLKPRRLSSSLSLNCLQAFTTGGRSKRPQDTSRLTQAPDTSCWAPGVYDWCLCTRVVGIFVGPARSGPPPSRSPVVWPPWSSVYPRRPLHSLTTRLRFTPVLLDLGFVVGERRCASVVFGEQTGTY